MEYQQESYETLYGGYRLIGAPGRRELTHAWGIAIGLTGLYAEALQANRSSATESAVDGSASGRVSGTRYPIPDIEKIAMRIADFLSTESFSFSPIGLIGLHRMLFECIYDGAGRLFHPEREMPVLARVFSAEAVYGYPDVSESSVARHLAGFASDIREIGCFPAGNDLVIAVFIAKHLRVLGYGRSGDGEEHARLLYRVLGCARKRCPSTVHFDGGL